MTRLRGGFVGVVTLLAALSASSAAAQPMPIAVMRQRADAFDVLVPIDEGLRPSSVGVPWVASLKHGGARVTTVQPLAEAHPAVRLEVAIAFDISGSFKKQLPAALKLAKQFVATTDQVGFDARFSVHALGVQRVTFGTDATAIQTAQLFDKVSVQPSEQRTQLRKLSGELIAETGRAVRFPDGVREVVLFTDGGEESAAFPDYAQIIDPATAEAVIVHAVLLQTDTSSTQAATLADMLGAAIERTGGSVIHVNPSDPSDPEMLKRLTAAAALPRTLVRVHVESCGLATREPGELEDGLSFTVAVPGQSPWRSSELPVKLQVPPGGVGPCSSVATSSTAAPSSSPNALASSTTGGTGALSVPVRGDDQARWWLWAIVGGLVASLIGVAIVAVRRRQPITPNFQAPDPHAGAPAPLPVQVSGAGASSIVPRLDPNRSPLVAPAPSTQEPTSSQPPLVVPQAAPWLEKHGANPLARMLATELHVETSPIPLGSPLRIARPEVRVGRDPTMELSLDLPSVSNHHATLFVDLSGELFVVDHGSTNGTFLEQQRLSVNQRHHVPAGSELSFSTHIRLRVVQPWRGNASPPPRPPSLPGHAPRRAATVVEPGGREKPS